MTILNESGMPDVLSPLYGVSGVCERLPYALVAVVGTRAEAHLTQTLSGLGPGAPRLPEGSRDVQEPVYLVVDPSSRVEQGQLATRIIGAASGLASTGTGLVLLFVSRSARLLGVDADFETRLARRRLGIPVLAVDLDPGEEESAVGPSRLSSDLEDRALAALVELCPEAEYETGEESSGEKNGGLLGGFLGRGRGSRREEESPPHHRAATLLSLQAAPGRGGRSLRELSEDMERAGIPVAGSIPGPTVGEFPALGEGSVVAPMDPYLNLASQAAAGRGAEVVETMLPIGVDGTARFIQDVAEATGASVGAGEAGRARSVWERLGGLRGRIRGKRFFFTGDTGLEIPLARFLADAGAVVTEVGTPRLDRRFLAAELQSLTGRGVDVVESPEWSTQLDRVDEAKPDIVIASPGLYVPLVARGYLCRSSLDFLGAGIHGYEGARRILELLVRTMDRAENLDSVEL